MNHPVLCISSTIYPVFPVLLSPLPYIHTHIQSYAYPPLISILIFSPMLTTFPLFPPVPHFTLNSYSQLLSREWFCIFIDFKGFTLIILLRHSIFFFDFVSFNQYLDSRFDILKGFHFHLLIIILFFFVPFLSLGSLCLSVFLLIFPFLFHRLFQNILRCHSQVATKQRAL